MRGETIFFILFFFTIHQREKHNWLASANEPKGSSFHLVQNFHWEHLQTTLVIDRRYFGLLFYLCEKCHGNAASVNHLMSMYFQQSQL